MIQKNTKWLLCFLLSSFSLTISAADFYWVASSASNWNSPSNWSATSGGPGGFGVPGNTDVAIFNANGLGNCTIDVLVNIG